MFNNTLSTAPRSRDLGIFLFLFLSRAAKCAVHARLQIRARRRSAGCFRACSGASGVWVTVGVGFTPASLSIGEEDAKLPQVGAYQSIVQVEMESLFLNKGGGAEQPIRL